MGKYKDALIEVSKDCKDYAMEWGFSKGACSKSLQLLQELVMEKELKPKLEQVKKEWEEYDYNCNIYNDEYHNGKSYKRCVIYKEIFKNKKLIVLHYYDKRISSSYYWENTDEEGYPKYEHMLFDITLQEHQLITKTMKALGWFDED